MSHARSRARIHQRVSYTSSSPKFKQERFAPANERNLKQTAPIRSIVHQNWSALLDLCMGETVDLQEP